MDAIYLEGLKIGLRLDKYVRQWVVRNSDYNVQTKRYLAVIRHSDGGDLNRRGQSCCCCCWSRGGCWFFFLLFSDFFLGGTTLFNLLFSFLLQLQ